LIKVVFTSGKIVSLFKDNTVMKNVVKSNRLSDAQMLVLQVVQQPSYDEKDLAELRTLLIKFNNEKLQEHLDKVVAEKGYTEEDFDKMLKWHQRKSN
jgi:hypothetical protein